MYRIEFARAANKGLKSIAKVDVERLKDAIYKLAEEPKPVGAKPVKGHPGYFRIRVGIYRVVYTIEADALVVLIIRVGHRKDIYRNLP